MALLPSGPLKRLTNMKLFKLAAGIAALIVGAPCLVQAVPVSLQSAAGQSTAGQRTTGQKPSTAEGLLRQAEKQAAKEHKNVLLIFHASWCGWCHRLDDLLGNKKLKPFFDSSYVIVHVDGMESPDKKADENPGWKEMMDKYGATNQGIPFWVIFSPKGKVLLDSKSPNDLDSSGKPGNMGFPDKSVPKDLNLFIEDLKKTSKMPAGFEADLRAYINGLDY